MFPHMQSVPILRLASSVSKNLLGSPRLIRIALTLPNLGMWWITYGSGNWQLLLCPHLQELSWSHTEADSCLLPSSPPFQPPFPPLLLKYPHLGKKSHPVCQRNMLWDWSSGNLFHFQLVNGPTENFRVLDSQSPKVNRALITQPKHSPPPSTHGQKLCQDSVSQHFTLPSRALHSIL